MNIVYLSQLRGLKGAMRKYPNAYDHMFVFNYNFANQHTPLKGVADRLYYSVALSDFQVLCRATHLRTIMDLYLLEKRGYFKL